jgi:low affinity Fe/Cu permease
MVFLIQNTQNRDMVTVQLKFSELILARTSLPRSMTSPTNSYSSFTMSVMRRRADIGFTKIATRKGSLAGTWMQAANCWPWLI